MYLSIGHVEGLPTNEAVIFAGLVDNFNYHQSANAKKQKYYEGNIKLSDVNLGIALPESFRNFELGCEWGSKTVDVLAARSMFDGFVDATGEAAEQMQALTFGNHLISEYKKACREELKTGCVFATLSRDPVLGCKIRFHNTSNATAFYNGEKGRVDCGFAIIDSVKSERDENIWEPSLINFYTDTAIWVLRRTGNRWRAQEYPHGMGRVLMVPFTWNATNTKPFGRSRLKSAIRGLIDGYVRTIANATIGLEYATSPQKYLLGISDDQYDALISEKFKQYIGSIMLATADPATGEKPTFGQLQQGTISPHISMMRLLATQFSAATGLTVTDTGVVNDANPTSSDAILAQSQTLVTLASELNEVNNDSLVLVAQMAQAIAQNKPLNALDDNEKNVVAHFKNPALPSVSVTTDAALKIASAREGFAGTDVFLEMVGFSQADIRRIKAQEMRARGANVLNTMFVEGANNG